MIPGIPTMGGVELLIILAIILLFFGAKRLPELARSLGRGKREFQQGIEEGEEPAEGETAEAQQQPAKVEASERGEESEVTLRKQARSAEAGEEEAGTQEEHEGSRAERSPR
jgi:sec-independent protein translocase protein TatA